MAQLIQLPRRAAVSTVQAVDNALRPLVPANSVDEWGRDDHLVRLLAPVMRLRWDAVIGGLEHVPAQRGALLVTNDRRFSYSPLWVALALSDATDRPVRFVGRPDSAPFGAALRRIGALLANPAEVHGALRHGELVVLGTSATTHPRHAGSVDPLIVGAAVTTRSAVLPVASMSTLLNRSARAEIGPVVTARTKRRGPLAEIELAETVQRRLQTMLDELGGAQTGVAPIVWLGEG